MPAAMASLPVGTKRIRIIRRNRQTIDFLGDQGVDQLDLLGCIGGRGTLIQNRYAQFLGSFLGAVVGGIEVGIAKVLGNQNKGLADQQRLGLSSGQPVAGLERPEAGAGA